jgi:hypothetical protein
MITSCDFKFVCPMKWDEMADLPDGSGKHCEQCQRPVITVHTRKEFKAAAKRGDCVAVFPEGEEKLQRLSGVPWPPDHPDAPKKRRRKLESWIKPGVARATRVVFRDTDEEVGSIHRDQTGHLVATCERLEWILATPIDIANRRIQPDEDDFLDAMPIAYSGALFRAEIVERAGEEVVPPMTGVSDEPETTDPMPPPDSPFKPDPADRDFTPPYDWSEIEGNLARPGRAPRHSP